MGPEGKEQEAEGLAEATRLVMETDSDDDARVKSWACRSCFRTNARVFVRCMFCNTDKPGRSEVIPEREGLAGLTQDVCDQGAERAWG